MEIVSFNLQDLLAPKAYAQSDAIAQPTFGPIDIGVTPQAQAKILLTSNTTSLVVGQTFTIDVEIRTGSPDLISVSEYQLVISFDPTKLKVLDADTSVAGTQIQFLDTLYQVVEGTNNVTAAGRITLTARTPSGAAYAINRSVARITFQAQQIGTTTITLPSGSTGNQLINQNGIALPLTLNTLTVAINTQQQASSSSSYTTSSYSSSSTSYYAGGTIPDTGLAEDLVANVPLICGFLLILLGVILSRSKRHEKK
jgi:hypothetical protein